MTASVVYVTASSAAEAEKIGRTLVEERLVACANIVQNITSMYWWDDAVQEEKEVVVFAKTRSELVDRVIERVKEIHSYKCPCVVSWPIEQANSQYLDWIAAETQK